MFQCRPVVPTHAADFVAHYVLRVRERHGLLSEVREREMAQHRLAAGAASISEMHAG
jgi:hypothetical protein